MPKPGEHKQTIEVSDIELVHIVNSIILEVQYTTQPVRFSADKLRLLLDLYDRLFPQAKDASERIMKEIKDAEAKQILEAQRQGQISSFEAQQSSVSKFKN